LRVAVNVEQLLHRSPGGIGRYTAQLLNLLPVLPPADEVVAFSAWHPVGTIRRALEAAGVPATLPVARVPAPRPLLYEGWVRLGQPPLRSIGRGPSAVDVVHAPSVAVPPRGSVPLVVTVHDAAPALYPEAFSRRGVRFHTNAWSAAARRADLVIADSQAAADEIVTCTPIPAERLRVVPLGASGRPVPADQLGRVLRRHGLADTPYVLWVGSLEPRKNVPRLVSAMARLRRLGRAEDVALVLAGYPGWLTDQQVDEADRSVLGDRLRQLGTVGDDDLWALYQGATVFAFPSRHEGFGLPVLEAMAQGTPVVCADIPALAEVAGEAVVRVSPSDTDAWAEAIGALLDDPAERARRATVGRDRAQRFSPAASIAGTRSVYREAIGG
jgi:glycosyltransferase involved in cell wall biosynthesis